MGGGLRRGGSRARACPPPPDTLYRIASITKLFTATSILQLRDAGALQLDDPVTRHLPWFAVASRHADAPPITIRHLITHTSGLPREAAFPYWTEGEFPTPDGSGRAWPGRRRCSRRRRGGSTRTSALALAGEVVAAASGEPYADYVAGHVLRAARHDEHARRLARSGRPAARARLRAPAARRKPRRRAVHRLARHHRRRQHDHVGERPRALRDAAVPRRARGRRPDPARQHAARDAPRALARARLAGGLGARLPRHARRQADARRPRRLGARLPDAAADLSGGQARGDRAHQRR